MSKIKKLFAVVLAVIVICFITAGSVIPAFADVQSTGQNEEQDTVDHNISSKYDDFEGVETQFKEYLQKKYGEDYEYYYSLIIDKWGSVEAYLLSLGDKLPEEYKTGWDKFVAWLGEYSVIWAPAFAIAIIILVAVIGKKQFNKLIDRLVNAKLSPIVRELNAQSNATVAILHSQKTLLGTNERFADTVKELENSEKELKNE